MDEPPIGEIPIVTNAAELRLPLDSYMYDTDLYVAMISAQTVLRSKCMARFGVTYSPDPPPGKPTLDLDRHNSRRYGLLDLDSARVRGYHADFPAGEPPVLGPVVREPKTEFSDYHYFLLAGRSRPEFADWELPLDRDGRPLPEEGCNGEASDIVSEGKSPMLGLYNEFGRQSHDLSRADRRVQAAMAEWSACMKRKGYDYADVFEPNDREWPDPPGEAERATAVADVECKIETNLVGIWAAVESAYQTVLIEENAEAFAAQRDFLDTIARNSARVLAEN